MQANSEVSALLGRIPSAVGYQPTLATDLGGLQERITTTDKGSITSVQVHDTYIEDAALFVSKISPTAYGRRQPSAGSHRSTVHFGINPFECSFNSWLPTGQSNVTIQAIYVPADDLTDPAPATTFAHLDATTVLSRSIAELGIYPAVDPLDSTSRMLDARICGQEHYDTARGVQEILQVSCNDMGNSARRW